MKTLRVLYFCLCFFLLSALSFELSFAADSATPTRTTIHQPTSFFKGVEQITFTFSSTDGTVERNANWSVAGVTGFIMKFHYIPDGTNTPDAAADIQVFPSLTGGVNLLYGACDNVGATETIGFPAEAINGGPVFLANDTLYFYAGSLGAGTNGGVLHLYILNP